MKIVSVTFKKNGKEYYFSCADNIEVSLKNKVIVETARGLELATISNDYVEKEGINEKTLMPVVRRATKKDLLTYEENKEKAKKAFNDFNRILKDFPDLDMTLISCEYNLDQSKILFMYVSDDRVDFRELLKSLANFFHKRIELKQIGARDKAKLVGGLGPCGMEICCTRYLREFDNISINMAKNQMLSLNPTKISGLCGRLLCCLKNENDAYTEAKRNFPKLGTQVVYEGKKMKITGINILLDELKIEGEGLIKNIGKDEVKW